MGVDGSPRLLWAWALVGLAVSIAVTALLWIFWVPGLFLFLFLPFLFVRFWRSKGDAPRRRACPVCGRAYGDPATRFCPRDGTRLP